MTCLNKAESAPVLYQDTAHFPSQDSYKDNEVETNVNHDITKTTAAIQILPPHNNRRVPLTSVQRTVVAYDEDAVMVPMHVGTIPPQSGNSLSIVEESTPAMSKITYMDLQPSPKPDLRTELVDDELDGNYIQKGTYNPPSKSSMSKSTSVLTSKSSNCASVPDSFIPVQEINTSENIMRLRKDDHFTDAIPISYPLYNMFNTIKNECETTWKKAVAKADTVKDPIETLVISLQRVFLNDSQNKEDDKINKEYKLDQDQSLKKKTICSNEVSPEEKRKCEPIKTDNWLIKTLSNASKLHGESCLKNSENQYESQIINSSNTKGDTVEEEYQILESDLTCNEIISADLRVLVTPIETTSSGRKVSREKKKNSTNKQGEETLVWAPVENRGLCGGRKRRFRDRAAERMVAEIDEEDDSRTAVIGKGYAIEKERWGIWYSSTRRRGLSKMARDKLENILNMIWNMEEAEFIKYAVVSTSIPDYYLIVKHPMDLSDIARKLRNIIYETIEQFVHDFRLIFYNIRLYNKKGSVYYQKGATLSQRFDELLEDNFTGWEFKSITGSPRELNTNPTLRYTAFDNHRKSTAKPLSQHNSQASSQPHLTTKETHFRPNDNPMLRGYDMYRTDKPFFDRASGGDSPPVSDLCYATLTVYHILVECRKCAPIRLYLDFKGDLRFLLHDIADELEQMELEVREVDAAARPRLRTHVDSYRAELGRLSQEFLKVRSPPFQDGFFGQDDSYGAGVSMKEEQKLRLLDNSERIERTGHHLNAGYRIILETEEIGTQVLQDLHSQRETIQKSRSRVRINNFD
uniref:Bromo domain-containing protein n=1 Tax=Timema shepardi TaxID=629360 RepID=A0A7R9AR95_TIMSH|nr:unnamed protein product [Timema shepardi]